MFEKQPLSQFKGPSQYWSAPKEEVKSVPESARVLEEALELNCVLAAVDGAERKRND